MLYYERKLKKSGYDLIIGVDEAGRGPLAGPVVAGAVCIQDKRFKSRIDDSKKLSSQQRLSAYLEIADKCFFGIGIVSEEVIDRINILKATQAAMESAIGGLLTKIKDLNKRRPYIIVDGNVKLSAAYPCLPIIDGDSKSKSIACASIMAKVTRDRIMCVYDRIYPEYGFVIHKGYPTEKHRRAIKRFGPSGIHRKTFCYAKA
ncbi:MAG: ribonuclease HII [Candidatus Omnitrophota bacterium]|jgi:ribonuclease HII|nr:MAG: ribonuclease HII [Candidatus Omnitrophota bacterium]